MSFLWGASGGIPYHLTALRYRRHLWRPFITTVNDWLCREWRPQARDLLLFGSSAGWTLEERFLARFDRIVAIEPDPLAGLLLRRRFPRQDVEVVRRADLLPWFQVSPKAFSDFLGERSGAAVLFSNVLGQLGLLKTRMTTPADSARAEFWRGLDGREWASYHDVLSSNHAGPFAPARPMPEGHERISDYAGEFFPEGSTAIDHETLWLTKDRRWLAIPWRLRPRQSHLIGCVRG